MKNTEFRLPTLWSMLREPQPHTIVRSIASLATGCLLAAGGLFASLFAAELLFQDSWLWRNNYAAIGLAAASVAWLLPLRWIWSPVRGRGQLVRPIFSTLAIAACASLLAALTRSEALVAVIVLLAISLTLFCWASAYARWVGMKMSTRENPIDVRCPQCRYSLVGLTECRCPECGHACTIDALIAAQSYGAASVRPQPRPRADAPAEAAAGRLATL